MPAATPPMMTMRRLGSSVECVFSASGSSMKKDALPSVDRSTPMVPSSACTALTTARPRPNPAWVDSRRCAAERLEGLFAQFLGHADDEAAETVRRMPMLLRPESATAGTTDLSAVLQRLHQEYQTEAAERAVAIHVESPHGSLHARGNAMNRAADQIPLAGQEDARVVAGPPDVARNIWRARWVPMIGESRGGRSNRWNFSTAGGCGILLPAVPLMAGPV